MKALGRASVAIYMTLDGKFIGSETDCPLSKLPDLVRYVEEWLTDTKKVIAEEEVDHE